MWINDMIRNQNGSGITQAGASEHATVSDGARQYRVQQQLRSMMPGQTLQGKIVGLNGRELQIQIGEDMVLNARLDQDIFVDMGKIMTFEVKNQTGNLLALRPLFTNMGTDTNVLKALDMAKLPINETTVTMTEAMMTEGMSVDKNNLQQFFKLTAAYPDSDPVSLVQLSKLGLEITPENITQLENYKALEHQLVKGMTDILEELPIQLQTMVQEGKTGEAVEFYQRLMDIQEPIGAQQQEETTVLTESKEMVSDASQQSAAVQSVGERDEIPQKTGEVPTREAVGTESEKETQPITIGSVLNEQEQANLVRQLETVVGERAQQLGDKELPIKEALQIIREMITTKDGSIKAEASTLLGEKELGRLLQSELTRQWLLQPKEVEKGTNVEELYQRLNSQLAKLSEALQAGGRTESTLSKQVQQLQNNIDFLNQLNHLVSYVQLPLKMNGQNTHGELYVYTNKRSLAKADGNVSALLHLDMEHLGPVDVYVAMQNGKVNTNFYLQDDEMLDFMENHIYLLNERLEKRGYQMQCNLSVREEVHNVMEEIIKENRDVTQVSQYSFDVRA